MIDFKINNRDLAQKGTGDVQLIRGFDAKKQSMLIRLSVERGSFIYDETLGSRLRLLLREKPSRVNEMANLYVREALEVEEDIIIERVETKWLDKREILILVFFSWSGITDTVEVII